MSLAKEAAGRKKLSVMGIAMITGIDRGGVENQAIPKPILANCEHANRFPLINAVTRNDVKSSQIIPLTCKRKQLGPRATNTGCGNRRPTFWRLSQSVRVDESSSYKGVRQVRNRVEGRRVLPLDPTCSDFFCNGLRKGPLHVPSASGAVAETLGSERSPEESGCEADAGAGADPEP